MVPAEREQQFGGAILFDHIDPELEVIPLLDSGTDCQDELSSPDGSPMVISPIVGLSPSQGEDDVDLVQILAFVTKDQGSSQHIRGVALRLRKRVFITASCDSGVSVRKCSE